MRLVVLRARKKVFIEWSANTVTFITSYLFFARHPDHQSWRGWRWYSSSSWFPKGVLQAPVLEATSPVEDEGLLWMDSLFTIESTQSLLSIKTILCIVQSWYWSWVLDNTTRYPAPGHCLLLDIKILPIMTNLGFSFFSRLIVFVVAVHVEWCASASSIRGLYWHEVQATCSQGRSSAVSLYRVPSEPSATKTDVVKVGAVEVDAIKADSGSWRGCQRRSAIVLLCIPERVPKVLEMMCWKLWRVGSVCWVCCRYWICWRRCALCCSVCWRPWRWAVVARLCAGVLEVMYWGLWGQALLARGIVGAGGDHRGDGWLKCDTMVRDVQWNSRTSDKSNWGWTAWDRTDIRCKITSFLTREYDWLQRIWLRNLSFLKASWSIRLVPPAWFCQWIVHMEKAISLDGREVG